MDRRIPVDVIFLDIDGVLLPFGSAKKNQSHQNGEDWEDCLFPKSTMNALTALLHRVSEISIKHNNETIKGNPVIVLSSTWRAQQEFIKDILNSFKAYVKHQVVEQQLQDSSVQKIWEPHLDAMFSLVDPTYHGHRVDEIFSWIDEHVGEENSRKKNSSTKKRKRRTPQELECTSTVTDFQVRSWIALDDEDLVNVEEGRTEKKAEKFAVKTESSIGLTLQDVATGLKLLEDQIRQFYNIT